MLTSLIFASSFLTATTFANSNDTTLRPRINRIVEKLKKDNYVHFGYAVGFSGERETKNKYYKRYQQLSRKATNEELVALTQNNSKNIVVYSFAILQARNFENLKSIFIQHINDTTFFWTAGGCTGFTERVNQFMLGRLKPFDLAVKNYLTKQEYDNYCVTFKKQDKWFACE